MKKRNSRLLGIGLSLALLLSCMAGCGQKSATEADKPAGADKPAQVYKLSFSIGDPAASSKATFYQGLADKTREATNGGIDITVFSGGTLFGHMEVLEGVLSGAADMGWFYTPWAPDQYPLTEVIGLPLQFGNEMASTYALQELYQQVPELQQELSTFKVLNLYTQPTNYIYSSKPIEKPDDLRGLQVRSMAGASAVCMTTWGASPVFMSAVEIYEAMDKGVIQGFVYEWSGTKSNTLYEVIDYVTTLPVTANPFMAIMNNDSYAKIPEEYKATFDEIWAAPQTSFDFAEMFVKEGEDSRLVGINDYGIQEIEADEAMLDLFRPGADAFIEDWISKNSTSSFDAREYFELAKTLYEEGCTLYPL